MLSAMRYKNFTWPHNPRTFRVLYQRRVTVLDAPGGRYSLQEVGKTCRILQGEGEFCGENAYDDFRRLAATFQLDGAGVLVHPLWKSQPVYFTRLELTQEPRADFVAYAFTFTEARGEETETQTAEADRVYIVKPGDTIWSILELYALDMKTLLGRNPLISNPNFLRPGQEVRLK